MKHAVALFIIQRRSEGALCRFLAQDAISQRAEALFPFSFGQVAPFAVGEISTWRYLAKAWPDLPAPEQAAIMAAGAAIRNVRRCGVKRRRFIMLSR